MHISNTPQLPNSGPPGQKRAKETRLCLHLTIRKAGILTVDQSQVLCLTRPATLPILNAIEGNRSSVILYRGEVKASCV